jgi:hypothetical protein
MLGHYQHGALQIKFAHGYPALNHFPVDFIYGLPHFNNHVPSFIRGLFLHIRVLLRLPPNLLFIFVSGQLLD